MNITFHNIPMHTIITTARSINDHNNISANATSPSSAGQDVQNRTDECIKQIDLRTPAPDSPSSLHDHTWTKTSEEPIHKPENNIVDQIALDSCEKKNDCPWSNFWATIASQRPDDEQSVISYFLEKRALLDLKNAKQENDFLIQCGVICGDLCDPPLYDLALMCYETALDHELEQTQKILIKMWIFGIHTLFDKRAEMIKSILSLVTALPKYDQTISYKMLSSQQERDAFLVMMRDIDKLPLPLLKGLFNNPMILGDNFDDRLKAVLTTIGHKGDERGFSFLSIIEYLSPSADKDKRKKICDDIKTNLASSLSSRTDPLEHDLALLAHAIISHEKIENKALINRCFQYAQNGNGLAIYLLKHFYCDQFEYKKAKEYAMQIIKKMQESHTHQKETLETSTWFSKNSSENSDTDSPFTNDAFLILRKKFQANTFPHLLQAAYLAYKAGDIKNARKYINNALKNKPDMNQDHLSIALTILAHTDLCNATKIFEFYGPKLFPDATWLDSADDKKIRFLSSILGMARAASIGKSSLFKQARTYADSVFSKATDDDQKAEAATILIALDKKEEKDSSGKEYRTFLETSGAKAAQQYRENIEKQKLLDTSAKSEPEKSSVTETGSNEAETEIDSDEHEEEVKRNRAKGIIAHRPPEKSRTQSASVNEKGATKTKRKTRRKARPPKVMGAQKRTHTSLKPSEETSDASAEQTKEDNILLPGMRFLDALNVAQQNGITLKKTKNGVIMHNDQTNEIRSMHTPHKEGSKVCPAAISDINELISHRKS